MGETKGWRLRKAEQDEQLAKDGVWVFIGNGLAEARVRPAGNPDHRRYTQARFKPYKRQIDAGTLAVDVQLAITAAAVARTILVDWRGVYFDDDEEEAEFSVELAEEMLTKYPVLLEDIIKAATDETAFQKEEDQEAAEALGKD